MEQLLDFDIMLFKLFNQELINPILDWLMPFITNKTHWLPVYILMIAAILFYRRKYGIFIVLVLLLTVGIANEISSHVIKEWVGRLRPCKELDDVRLLISCGGGKSFPSSHATNNFAMAFVLHNYFRRLWFVFYPLAAMVAFSRVYVGVHYPIDIASGALLGTLIALIMINVANRSEKFIFKNKAD